MRQDKIDLYPPPVKSPETSSEARIMIYRFHYSLTITQRNKHHNHLSCQLLSLVSIDLIESSIQTQRQSHSNRDTIQYLISTASRNFIQFNFSILMYDQKLHE